MMFRRWYMVLPVVFFFLFFLTVTVPVANAGLVETFVARALFGVIAPASMLTVGGVILAMVIGGVTGYILLPPGTTAGIGQWFLNTFYGSANMPAPDGTPATVTMNGVTYTISTPDVGGGQFQWGITASPLRDYGGGFNITQAPGNFGVGGSAVQSHQYVSDSAKAAIAYDQVAWGFPVSASQVVLDGAVAAMPSTVIDATGIDFTSMPSQAAYMTPGLSTFGGGAVPSVVATGQTAAQVEQFAKDHGVPQTTTTTFDKSGLATDSNQVAQIAQGTSIISEISKIGTAISAIPDNIVSSITAAFVPTLPVEDRINSLRTAASTKFPFSIGSYTTGYQSASGFTIPTWELAPGHAGTAVHTDILNGVFGAVISFARGLLVFIMWCGTVLLIYRRMVAL